MTADFQLSLLCYLVQAEDGIKYVSFVNEEVFDRSEFKLTAQVLKRYYKNHKRLPGRLDYEEFLDREISATRDIPDTLAGELRSIGSKLYQPLSDADRRHISDQFTLSIQRKQIDLAMVDYSKGVITEKDLFDKINQVSSIIDEEAEDLYKDSGFLVADRNKHRYEKIEGEPTFLQDLNSLTAAGGFYSPQLIIFMSGPKHFKTGLLIKLAIEYARDGYKVYYADGENGVRSVRNRAKMAIMECELTELFDPGIKEELDKTLECFGRSMGGELYIDSFPAMTKCIKDVEGRLDYLKREHKFEPQIIIYDSIDHFIPNDEIDRRRDPRIQIQKVYHQAIALNKRRGTFAIAPSQVNRSAVDKRIFSMKDVSEDFGKIMNAHAVFAICATSDEMEEGIRRIVPVAQREGIKQTKNAMCIIKVDESRMIVEEVDKDALNMEVDDQ